MEEKISPFAKIIANDNLDEFTAFIQENILSTEDELLLIQSNKTDWLSAYIDNNNISKENLCAFVKTELEPEKIFYKIKTVGALSQELQKAIILSFNEKLWDLVIEKYSFADNVLIPLVKLNNSSLFLKKYIAKRFLQLDGQKALIRSGNIELIDMYIKVHGFFREAQREFLYYLY